MKLIIDTNCYLSFLNRRNEKQHMLVSNLVAAVSRAEHEVLVTGHNISEIVFVLQSVYHLKHASIKAMLAALFANPGFEFSHGYYPEEILKLWPGKIRDFGDAVLGSAASMLEAKVYTFDRIFARSLSKLHLLADLP